MDGIFSSFGIIRSSRSMAVGLFSFGCGSLLDAFGSQEKSGVLGAISNCVDSLETKGLNSGGLSPLLAESSVL